MKFKATLRKFFCCILAITMLIIPTCSFAANTPAPAQLMWTYIRACQHSLVQVGTQRKLSLCTDIEAYDGVYTGIMAQLQKYNFTTGRWDNIEDEFWSFIHESEYCYIDETVNVSPGVYRFNLVFSAYDTNWVEVEFFDCYTDQVTIN